MLPFFLQTDDFESEMDRVCWMKLDVLLATVGYCWLLLAVGSLLLAGSSCCWQLLTFLLVKRHPI
jgi:hypothetical protein